MRALNAIWSRALAGAAALVVAGSAWAQPPMEEPAPVLAVVNPKRLAAGADNEVLVSDRRYGAIIAVDKASLEPLWSFTLPNEGMPFGLATTKKMVFVGNSATKNVEAYKMQAVGGEMSLSFAFNFGGVPEGAMGDIEKPVSIAVDSNQKLVFVLDAAAKEIKIFDHKGRAIGAISPADTSGLVASPVAIAIDELRGHVLVADYGDMSAACSVCPRKAAARILAYNYNGVLQFQIDGDGLVHDSPTRIGFARVQGMAVSDDGRIFVADPLGSRIFVLDSGGVLLDQIGLEGSAPGELMLPLDVLLDRATGDLFISNNRGARRIEVFRGAGGSL